jgi:RimJ/RimL family protein N-acetyltransferase
MIWEHVAAMPYFLDDSTRNPYIFEQIIGSPDTVAFMIGRPAQGIMWAFSVNEGYHAGVAIALWGKDAMGQVEVIRTAVKSVFKAKNLHRMFALICVENAPALALGKRLNFRQEGTIREGMRYSGVWKDVAMLGLLKDEV